MKDLTLDSTVLRQKGALPETGNNKKLVPVSLSTKQSDMPQIPYRISLPNGVVIELPSTHQYLPMRANYDQTK